MTHDTFGRVLPEPLADFDPESSCWRMSGGMFPSDSMPSLVTFPASGMTRAGALFELPTLVPPMVGHECSSLLPTPVTTDLKTSSLADARRNSPGLRAVDALLPTPRTSDTNGAGEHGRGGPDLRTAVSLLPTPRATDGTNGGPNQRGSKGDLMLPSAVIQLLPTPAVNDMGEGKTVDAWDEWTAKMQAKHGNGNGHGKPLSIRGQRIGESTAPPSDAGNTSQGG